MESPWTPTYPTLSATARKRRLQAPVLLHKLPQPNSRRLGQVEDVVAGRLLQIHRIDLGGAGDADGQNDLFDEDNGLGLVSAPGQQEAYLEK
jgi:hypothetical protein